MDVYLALANGGGSYVFKNKSEESLMEVFLAGLQSEKNRANYLGDFAQKIYVLESFYYIQDWMIPFINNHWKFILDSGAFTFMSNIKKGDNLNWDEYVENYADFINEHNIDLFFELDIDVIVGIKEVERLRDKLEYITSKKCIPVWHKSRGLDYWKKINKGYDYIAIGGIVSGEIKRNEYKFFNPLLKIAKENGTKVHGLGFTNEKGLQEYKFDSVDSTAWIYGNRGGFLYYFNGNKIIKRYKPEGLRLNGKEVAVHNFKEWVKFQRYAKNNL